MFIGKNKITWMNREIEKAIEEGSYSEDLKEAAQLWIEENNLSGEYEVINTNYISDEDIVFHNVPYIVPKVG